MNLCHVAILAAGLPENPTPVDLVTFSLSGMLVVVLSLTLLAVCCAVIGYFLRRLTPSPLPSRTASSSRETDLPEETVVVIAAAVSAAICAPHRIVQIRGLTPEDMSWSLEGRLQHHASHTPKFRH